ncbi:MAG: glycosyltransferase [Acidobacteria bacterium]|nr:glycosyltransferase [Acidobacteriota bacterium]
MIRIAHLIPSLGTGGAETMLANLLSLTDRRRFAPLVIALSDDQGPVADRIAGLGVPVHVCGMRRGAPGLASTLRLLSLVRSAKPHLLQAWMYHGNLAALAAGALAAPGAPVLWNLRGANPDLRQEKPLTGAVIRLGGKLSRRASAIIVNSMEGARLHRECFGYRCRRWEIIPNGFDTERFAPSAESRRSVRQELRLPPDALLVGLISRYHPMKDHDNFLRAAAIVYRSVPCIRFLMTGRCVDDPAGPVSRLVSRLGLDACVFGLGERGDIARIDAALDIACSASWSESFPTSVGEAMACGVPCVVTDVGDSGFLVDDTGLQVPPRNPEALAGAMLDLIGRGAGARRALGQAARQRILQKFALESVTARYEALYVDLLAERRKGERRCVA